MRALRRLFKVRQTVAVYRSRWVRESTRFALREIIGTGGGEHVYRLRRSDGRVVLRHGTPDLEIFHELVVADAYAPPSAAKPMLNANPPRSIVDLGANVGLFGVVAQERWRNAELVAFEPDPDNAAVLRRCIAANGADGRWKVVEAFAAAEDGETRFLASHDSHSRAAWDVEEHDVITVPAVDIFGYLGTADLLKIDIEGAEWPIISDPRFAASSLTAIVLEYHGAAGSEPHERASALLRDAGFELLTCHRDDSLGVGTIWGWRKVS